MKFKSRYVHAISPRDNDYGPEVEVSEADLHDRKKLAAKLRAERVLSRGDSIQSFRKEPGGVVVFPKGGRLGMPLSWRLPCTKATPSAGSPNKS